MSKFVSADIIPAGPIAKSASEKQCLIERNAALLSTETIPFFGYRAGAGTGAKSEKSVLTQTSKPFRYA